MPGARIVIEDTDERVLLQLRSDFDIWGLPGGMPEPGESVKQAIEREVFEETGLTVESCHPFGFGSNPERETFTYPNGDKCQHFVLNFYTSAFSGSPTSNSDETLRLEWFATSDLPEMLPNMRRSVDAFLEFKATECSNSSNAIVCLGAGVSISKSQNYGSPFELTDPLHCRHDFRWS